MKALLNGWCRSARVPLLRRRRNRWLIKSTVDAAPLGGSYEFRVKGTWVVVGLIEEATDLARGLECLNFVFSGWL